MAMIVKQHLDLQGLYFLNAGIEALTTAPANPKLNQVYIALPSNVFMRWDGTQWVMVGAVGGMHYKGTVGTGGTVTVLPTDVTTIENGDLYVVCAEGTYSSQHAVIGDMFIAKKDETSTPATVTWQYVPSGNDKYSEEITGDGSTTSFTINHKLNTLDVQVQIYDTVSATGDTVLAEIQHTDANNIKVVFGTAPAATEKYKVVVLA